MMWRSGFVTISIVLAGCTVGPKYRTPTVPMTDTFKEAIPADYKTAGVWRPALPSDGMSRGQWWRIFGDPQLDTLEDELTVSNQNLKLEEARFRQARAMIGFQRADEFPTISVGANAASLQDSSHQPYFLIANPQPEGELQLPFDLNYEVDLWGRIRRTVSAAREEAQATAADLATVSLSLHAELALDYIELRSADAQQRLLDDTVKAYQAAEIRLYRTLSVRFTDVLDSLENLDRCVVPTVRLLRCSATLAPKLLCRRPTRCEPSARW